MKRVLVAIFVIALAVVAAQCIVLPATAAQVQNASPAQTGSGPEQPIPFSHKTHAGTAKLPCELCHKLSRSGDSFVIPQAPVCMQCHQVVAKDKPDIQQLAAFAKEGRIIPWVRVYEVPSFVTFSHKTHLDHGNTCQDCHGPVAERDRLSRETDISMTGCLACHRAKQAATDCNTCHVLEQANLNGSYRQMIFHDEASLRRERLDSFLRPLY